MINLVQGQDRISTALLKAIEQLPSAMVFYGPEGVGKALMALNLAQILLCENRSEPSRACGICGSCLRVAKKQSEGLFWVEPEGNVHKIQTSRDIIDFLSLQAVSGRSRLVVINDAHLLNAQASNSLLKILEEPPPNVYFILLTHKLDNLLSTIRSRTVHFRFLPLPNEVIRKIHGNAPEWSIRASRGSIENLKNLLEPEVEEGRKWAADLLQAFLQDGTQMHTFPWREDIKTRDFAITVSRVWLQYLRDAFFVELHPELVIHQDQIGLIQTLIKLPKEFVSQIAEYVLEMEPALSANRDPLLVYEEFFVKTLRLKS